MHQVCNNTTSVLTKLVVAQNLHAHGFWWSGVCTQRVGSGVTFALARLALALVWETCTFNLDNDTLKQHDDWVSIFILNWSKLRVNL